LQKNLEGKLTKNAGLALIADRAFINETLRWDDTGEKSGPEICKYSAPPIFEIFLLEWSTNNPVDSFTPNTISDYRNTINTDISSVLCNFINNPTFVETNTIGTPGYNNDFIKNAWDNTNPGGWNSKQYNSTNIIAGYCSYDTSAAPSGGKRLWLHELFQALCASGDSDIYPSVNNNNNTYTSFQPKDYMLGRIIYPPEYGRKAGNKNLGTDDNQDIDPDGSIWNP